MIPSRHGESVSMIPWSPPWTRWVLLTKQNIQYGPFYWPHRILAKSQNRWWRTMVHGGGVDSSSSSLPSIIQTITATTMSGPLITTLHYTTQDLSISRDCTSPPSTAPITNKSLHHPPLPSPEDPLNPPPRIKEMIQQSKSLFENIQYNILL